MAKGCWHIVKSNHVTRYNKNDQKPSLFIFLKKTNFQAQQKKCTFAEKLQMTVNSQNALKIVLHVAFCVLTVVLFGTFCKLRTATAWHPYKEYLSGVVVLGMMYLNVYVLFPVFFKTGRIQQYLLTGILTVLAACIIEMIMVSKDVIHILQLQFAEHEVHDFFLTDCFYVLLRDMALFFASFSVSALPYYAAMNHDKELSLVRELQLLDAKKDDKEKSDIRIKIPRVAYICQKQNYTYIYLTNGEHVIRYGSLKQLKGLLDDNSYVQLSSKILAMCKNILHYDAAGVVVKIAPKGVLLCYSHQYRDKAMGELFRKTNLDPNENTSEKQTRQQPAYRRRRREKSEKLIFDFISEHPGCSASDIKKNRSLSQTSVNRIIKQLKDEGRIEHVGGRRNGGYRAVEATQKRETAETDRQENAIEKETVQ